MKIVTFRVPCRVYKENGNILIQVLEEKRTQLKEESIILDPMDIPQKAKELADQNDANFTIAKSVLFARDLETETFVNLSYLMD